MIDQPISPAMKQFRALVRKRRSLVGRKDKNDPDTYFACSLMQVLGQVSKEIDAGVHHDEAERKRLLALADEFIAEQDAAEAAKKPKRFRGIGRS